MTAPYAADTPEIIKDSHRQVFRASLTHPDMVGSVILDVISASLGWDESRVPCVRAALEVAPFAAPGLDPRIGARVTLECGYVRPGGEEDVHVIADLGVRSLTHRRPDDVYEMEAVSDEALVIDASPVVEESVSATNHALAIRHLIARSVNPWPRYVDKSYSAGGPVTVDVLTDRWDTVMDLADREDLAVYDNGLRRWEIHKRPELADVPEHSLTVGQDGTLLDTQTTVTRDDWNNYVTLVYDWRDDADVDHQIKANAYVNSGTLSILGVAGKKAMVDFRSMATTQEAANAAARTILVRAMSRSQKYSLKAVAAYWVRPGMTVEVTLPDALPDLHLVSTVTFDPIEGTMDLTTRLPVSYVGTTPEGGGGDTGGGDPEPDPEPPSVETFQSTWTANGSEAYLGSGNRWGSTDEPVQGWTSGTGNNQGIAVFTSANSTGDETGRTITQALSGLSAEDIEKVEVYLYANHWWNSSGGTARIGFYDGASVPNTFTGAEPYIDVPGWSRDSGRWVNITSPATKAALIAGGRGITVGPGKGTSAVYYGRFNSASAASDRPQLRITYTKEA